MISIGLLGLAWLVYDAVVACSPTGRRSPSRCGLVTVTSYGVARLPGSGGVHPGRVSERSGRNACDHPRPLGTGASEGAAAPRSAPGIVAKQRSVHNNYLTCPCCSRCRRPLPVHVHARPRPGRTGRADGGGRRDPPLLQPASRRRRSGGSPSAAPARPWRSPSATAARPPRRREPRRCRSPRRTRSCRHGAHRVIR